VLGVPSGAMDIKARGQIAGLGSVSGDNSHAHLFRLAPVPVPALLLAAGQLALGWLRRRTVPS